MELPNFFRRKENKNPYKYFTEKGDRHDIFEFSKGLTEYLHNNKIPNLIFLDRSPRPLWVGVDEYWKLNYKAEKRPNIYFVNPDGFDVAKKATQGMGEHEQLMDQLVFSLTGESVILERARGMQQDISDKFKEQYSYLERDKDKPVAVFDNCIHTGATAMSVLSTLYKAGFKDVRVVIGSTRLDVSPVEIDKDFSYKVDLITCGLLGTDSGVKKEQDRLFSSYDKEADREKVIQSREEVRRIVKELN